MAVALIIPSAPRVLFSKSPRPAGQWRRTGAPAAALSSQTMPYTGLLILAFIGVHLSTFSHHIVDQTTRNIFQIAVAVFSQKIYLAIYLLGVVVVAFHVRHGLWSALQTVGASHPKYTPFIHQLSIVFAVIVGIGFFSLPLVILTMR
jgi:succinate dehydrogenase / fumarate reductase cytochrome b subunit